jgi:hypothetical protein
MGGKLNCSEQSSLLFLTHPCRHQDEEASVIASFSLHRRKLLWLTGTNLWTKEKMQPQWKHEIVKENVHCVQSLLLKVLSILDQIDCYFRVWISSSSSLSSCCCCLDKVEESDKDSHGNNGRTKVCEACRLTTTCSFRLLLLLQHSTPGLRKRTRKFFNAQKTHNREP